MDQEYTDHSTTFALVNPVHRWETDEPAMLACRERMPTRVVVARLLCTVCGLKLSAVTGADLEQANRLTAEGLIYAETRPCVKPA